MLLSDLFKEKDTEAFNIITTEEGYSIFEEAIKLNILPKPNKVTSLQDRNGLDCKSIEYIIDNPDAKYIKSIYTCLATLITSNISYLYIRMNKDLENIEIKRYEGNIKLDINFTFKGYILIDNTVE